MGDRIRARARVSVRVRIGARARVRDSLEHLELAALYRGFRERLAAA